MEPARLAHAVVPHLSYEDAVRFAASVPEAEAVVMRRPDVAALADFRGPRLLGMFKAFDRLCAALFPESTPVFDHPPDTDVGALRRALLGAGIFHILNVPSAPFAVTGQAAVRLGGRLVHVSMAVNMVHGNNVVRSVRLHDGATLCGAVQKTTDGAAREWQLYGNDGVPLAFHEMCVAAFGVERMRDLLIPGCNSSFVPYFVSDAQIDYTTLLTV